MMNGYTACLKTTTARRLATVLNIPLIETNKFGHCTNEAGLLEQSFRERRYEIGFDVASILLNKGIPFIFDGTFSNPDWRKKVYLLAQNKGVDDVIVVKCFCDNRRIINLRLEAKKLNPLLPENEVTKLDNYDMTKKQFELSPVEEDTMPIGKKPSIICFDSGKYVIETARSYSQTANIVDDAIFKSIALGKLNDY